MIAGVELEWLRPQWLWALLGLIPGVLLAWRHQRAAGWARVVDAHLLPHLLEPGHARRGLLRAWPALLAYALAVLALAGPSLGRAPAPAWQVRMPLVIVLDLSSAARATDIAPNRLAIARQSISEALRLRAGAPVALVAFAGAPFTVAPLTDDPANVAVFLDALAPDVMPVDGRRTDAALRHAADLLARAGHARGRVLLMSDGADANAIGAAEALQATGIRVDVLGIGGETGALLRTPEGLRRVRLDAASLEALARAGGGRYATAAAGEGDLRSLGVADAGSMDGVAGTPRGQARRDDGIWLVPAVLLLVLPAFRRRAGALAVLAVVALIPVQVRANELWRRADQAAHARMVEGHRDFRAGRFDAAAQAYAGVPGADAHYNRGNALAKAGQYEAAINAYSDALRTQPGMADAVANREAVRRAMQRKNPASGERPGQSRRCRPGEKGCAGNERSERPCVSGSANCVSNQPARDPSSPPGRPRDAAAQARADAALREQQRRAQSRASTSPTPSQGDAPQSARRETAAERQQRLANAAALRRVPDDPGALLRAKFQLEYERRRREGGAP